MRKLLLAILALALSPAALAATYPISAGASTATIQSTLVAAGNDNTGPSIVSFAAGAYSITSQITIPCPKQPMTIQGVPPVGVGMSWPITPTAVLTNGGMVNTAGFRTNACGVAVTIQYLQYNGANPSSGGGFIYVAPGTNNLTIQYNWFYGVSAQQSASDISDSFIWLDGSDVNGSTRTQNTTIRWNRLGTPNSSDCANLMNVIGGHTDNTVSPYGVCQQFGGLHYTYVTSHGVSVNATAGYVGGGSSACIYQDGNDEKSAGGYCAGVGVHAKTDNLNISNNVIAHVEQGIKLFEGCGSNTCPDQFDPSNMLINANDFTQMHRITLEGQQTPKGSPGVVVSNNSQHDQILFGGVSWGLSLPQGSATVVTPTGPTIHSSNLLIENNLKGVDKNGYGASRSYCDEFWGNGSIYSTNLCQGYWGGGTAWGFGAAPWAINNNTFEQATNYFENYISNEEGAPNAPTQVGNVTTHTITTATSAAPTIAPSSGSQSFPLTVALTDSGYTSGSLPQGNTGIWYTTDGSTPVPGAGTAKYLSSGQTFVLPACGGSCAVKAVGMWGALNQPTSYASGYGFVPSSVVTATYTGGGTPTTATPVMSPTSQTFFVSQAVSVSDSTPSSSIFCTTNGTTPTPSSPPYTGPFTFTATTNLQCMATAAGFLNSAVANETYTLSIPSLTSCNQQNAGSVNTLTIGGSAQQFAQCGYAATGELLTCSPNADKYGNVATNWGFTGTAISVGAIGNPAGCTGGLTGPGCVTGQAAGTGNSTLQVSTTHICSPWGWTVISSPFLHPPVTPRGVSR